MVDTDGYLADTEQKQEGPSNIRALTRDLDPASPELEEGG
jgi:hypothetical protein